MKTENWTINRRTALLGATSLAAASVVGLTPAMPVAQAQAAAAAAVQPVSAEEALAIATEAYLFLYPLITMDVTRKQFINMPPPLGGPENVFAHLRAFPPAEMRSVVRPNFDTLYSSVWLDLTEGPVIVSTEDTEGRYFMLPMIDMWTDVFAVPGKRTNGTGAANFAVVPPNWSGELPGDVERIDAPTPYVWIIGRTQTNGVEDYPAVHKIQDGFRATLLADWGKTPRKIEQTIDASVDTETEPLRLVNGMSATDYFSYGAELMTLHPPHVSDWSIMAQMQRIGIAPGHFDANVAGADLLGEAAAAALARMQDQSTKLGRVANGWLMNTDTMGVYGNYYLKRAIITLVGLGANPAEDAIYPLAIVDADGQPITAENKYVMHFDSSELPPVSAFWSLTMYDDEGFQVANTLDRFAIGDRDALKFNGDGSLDLYIQHETPGADKESNWLPGPAKGPLGLTMRLYAPKLEALDGRWNPPAIRRAD